MCLYPRLLRNKKYMPTKKNGYNPPQLLDERLKWVSAGCGQCMECRKQYARNWQVRLTEESKIWKYKIFCTFSFSPESLEQLTTKYNLKDVNDVATKAMRLFLERYRKKNKKSIHHWFVTELGHTNTERIHLHGLIFTNELENIKDVIKTWNYGNYWIGEDFGQRTINYIIKYITKVDTDHKGYKAKVLTSAGIGRNYIKSTNAQTNLFNGKETKETYTLPNGNHINLPIYYRNKIYSEEEREKLWINKIEEDTIYVCGVPIKNVGSDAGRHEYEHYLKQMQIHNRELGYGSDKWNKKKYMVTLKMLNKHAKKNKK